MKPRSPASDEPFDSQQKILEIRARKRRARRRWALITTSAALIAGTGALVGIGAAGYLVASNPTVRNVVSAVVHRDISPDRAFPGRDSLTMVVIGADQDRDDRDQVTGKAHRSDTLMVARFDFANQRAGIVSIPRDSKVHIPGRSGYRKINAAFAYGGKDLTKQVVQNILGVSPDNVAIVNFDGFKRMVDLLGGVPVTVDKPLHYDDNWGNLHVHLDPGDHWLTGEQALGYVRIRKVDSDLHRAERQQAFVQALKGRLADPRVWFRASSLITEARSAIQTDLNDAQLLSLSAFLKNLPPGAVQTATLPGDEGPSFVTLDPNAVREVARNLLAVENAPLDGLGGRERLARRSSHRSRFNDRSSDMTDSRSASDAEASAWNDAPAPPAPARSRTRRRHHPKTSGKSNPHSAAAYPLEGRTDTAASPDGTGTAVHVQEVPASESPSRSDESPSPDEQTHT